MFETITKHVRENSVVRFLLSHLIILLAALLICAVGFRSAFVIVRNDVLDSTMFAMTQAVSSVDNGLTELRTLGMQTARSESIYRLENLRHTDDNYYQNIIRAINEYYQRMLYYSPNWVNNTFIYLNSMDRVIYNRAVYAPDIFSGYLLEWGDDAALWQAVCTDDNRAPFFCKLGGQDIYYGIPSSRLMSSKTGTVFFRIDSDWLEEKFSFLEQYNGYSLFVLDDDNGGVCLYSHDDLSLADSLPEDWLTAQGTWNSGNDLVLHLAGSDSLGLSYLLVLPEQQAMRQLNTLRNQMLFLIFAAVVLGTAVSLYFSVRRGRPVNEIARALQAADGAVNTDLNLISSAVSQLVQDNTHLLQEQAADRPALQTAFYHNLLKSNFVSRPEMEYMAQRAGIERQIKPTAPPCCAYSPVLILTPLTARPWRTPRCCSRPSAPMWTSCACALCTTTSAIPWKPCICLRSRTRKNCWACCTALRRGCMSNTMWKPIGALAPPAMT